MTRLRILPKLRGDPRKLITVVAVIFAPMALCGQAAAQDPTLAAAGDIACDPDDSGYNGGAGTSNRCRQRATSDLLVGAELAAVLPLGDIQYDSASTSELNAVYHPTWGRVKSISRPVLGNHETSGTGYFNYFNGVGQADGPAGPRGKGWYSFDVGSWHVVALNSNCSRPADTTDVVDCSNTSEQVTWLRADLAAHPAECTLAYWHHPRYSSGHDGSNAFTQPLWDALDDAGAEIVLSGHSHDYERFAALDRNGNAAPSNGIRQFVVGTGGAFFTGLSSPIPQSQRSQNDTFGVLFLTLHATSYEWNFVPEAGRTFTDSGADVCRGAPPPPPPPPPPALTATNPASPANQNSPKVMGAAEGGSTVRLYKNASCAGSPAATGSAAAFSSPGLTVSVADNSSTRVFGSATNVGGSTSACSSTSIIYVEDSTPPGRPTLTDTDPDSPANHNSPNVKGAADPGSTVRLYTNPGCSGSRVASGSAAAFSSPGLTAPVADNSSTTFYATASDGSGNASACSSSSITYVENSRVPPTDSEGGGVVEVFPGADNVFPAADITAPGVTLAGSNTQRLGRTVMVLLTATTEDLWVTASGTVSLPGASRVFRLKPVRDRMVTRGTKVVLRLKLSTTARRAIERALLRRARVKVQLKLSVRDPAGNVTTRTRAIRLRL